MSDLDDRSESQQRIDYASRAFYHRVTYEGLARTTALDQVTEEWELNAQEQAAVINAQPPLADQQSTRNSVTSQATDRK